MTTPPSGQPYCGPESRAGGVVVIRAWPGLSQSIVMGAMSVQAGLAPVTGAVHTAATTPAATTNERWRRCRRETDIMS